MNLKDLFTESDNDTPCPVRVGAAITAFIYHAGIALGIYVSSIHVDLISLGLYIQHMMTLIGVGGATIGAKAVLKGDAPHA